MYAYTFHAVVPNTVGSPGGATTVRFVPLSGPLITGFELLIRIRYPVPAGTAGGMVAAMVPALTEVRVPSVYVVPLKLPVASDNSAVNTLLKPVLVKLQVLVNVMLNALFKQNEVPVKEGTEMAGALIVMFELLILPVIAGLELTIRTRYVVPEGVLKGMVALMFPEVAVLVVTGVSETNEVKVASVASCMRNWLPGPNVTLLLVKGTVIVAPAQ